MKRDTDFFDPPNNGVLTFLDPPNNGASTFLDPPNNGASTFFDPTNNGAKTFFRVLKFLLPGPVDRQILPAPSP